MQEIPKVARERFGVQASACVLGLGPQKGSEYRLQPAFWGSARRLKPVLRTKTFRFELKKVTFRIACGGVGAARIIVESCGPIGEGRVTFCA
jgi:hypothetical protein